LDIRGTESAVPEDPLVLALDAEGGDNAPEGSGSRRTSGRVGGPACPSGREPGVIEPLLAGPTGVFVSIEPSGSVISYHDEPAHRCQDHGDSSIVVGARTVADGRSSGFVSAVVRGPCSLQAC